MTTLSERRANHHGHQAHGRNIRLKEDKSIESELIAMNTTTTGQIKLTSASAPTVYGGETVPIADDSDRPGWLFTKPLAGTAKFNYFYYGEGNTPMTLGDLKSLVAEVSVDNYQAINSLPFFVVYTKLTGVGDAGAWFHSKIAYTLTTNEKIMLGEKVQFWAGSVKPSSPNHLRQVENNLKITTGTALDSEEIFTISFHSDSGSPALTQILVSNLGFDMSNISSRVNLIV